MSDATIKVTITTEDVTLELTPGSNDLDNTVAQLLSLRFEKVLNETLKEIEGQVSEVIYH